MQTRVTLEVLNQLLAIHTSSFLVYLAQASPWSRSSNQNAVETLRRIVDDQRAMIDRLSEAILDLGGSPEPGEFPMEFTSYNDLSLQYVIRLAVDRQRADTTSIQQCVEYLRSRGAACPLAEEALGLAKGHLESLEELAAEHAVS